MAEQNQSFIICFHCCYEMVWIVKLVHGEKIHFYTAYIDSNIVMVHH